MTRGAYDIQKLRIMMGNRIVGNFKARLGQTPGMPESELTDDAKEILAALRAAHDRITDAIVGFPKQDQFDGDEVISSYAELCLVNQYIALESAELSLFGRLTQVLETFPIFNEYLLGVKGVGPRMAAVLISEFDPAVARHVSSFWKYAGLDVAPDGRGRGRYKEHLVKRAYTTTDGTEEERDSITYNPWLKTKLMGVLAKQFLRNKSPWSEVYYDYRHRLECHAKYGIHNDKAKDDDGKRITNKGRRHEMALRYMIKMFLAELWVTWREMEGLPVTKPYAEAVLERESHGQVNAGVV